MKFSLVVTRTMGAREIPNPYNIEITDETSRVKIRLKLTARQLADVISNTHVEGIEGEIQGIASNIGKLKVREERQIKIPKTSLPTYAAKEVYSKYLEENAQEEGWHLDSYMGSQKSVIYSGDEIILNYAVYKWV
jgi:hypothetical protein